MGFFLPHKKTMIMAEIEAILKYSMHGIPEEDQAIWSAKPLAEKDLKQSRGGMETN